MDDTTVGMTTSEMKAASVDTGAVAGVDAEAEAEAVLSARSDEAFPIQNNRGCGRRLLSRPGEDLLTLPRQPNNSPGHYQRLYLLNNYL